MSDDGPEWFAPKRFGYGSGLPIAWQGWAILIGYIAITVIALSFAATRPIVIFAVMIPATVALMLVTARTTRGGWRWRWGDKD
jgi:hypothetical protein